MQMGDLFHKEVTKMGGFEMTTCAACNHEWEKKEVLSLLMSTNGKACPNCGKQQYLSMETRKWYSLGILSLLFIFIFPLIVIKLTSEENDPMW